MATKILNEQFNADQAKLLTRDTRSLDGEYLRKETNECLDIIKRAAMNGKDSTEVYHIDYIIKERLASLGFSVRVVSDQRDGDYMAVSWYVAE